MPTHAEKRLLPYSPERLFALVADVGRYPEFLPWCLAARVHERKGDVLVADLIIGFKMIRERFTSQVTLDFPRRIDVTYTKGPLRYLNNHWTFEPCPASAGAPAGGTMIDFYIDFEFHSKVLQSLIGVLFNEAVKRMVGAFEARAHQLYAESRPSEAARPV